MPRFDLGNGVLNRFPALRSCAGRSRVILGLSLNFGQFDKPVAYRLRSLVGKPHLSDNLEQPHLPLHPRPHRTQAEHLIYSVLRLRSQVTNPIPMLPSKIAEGAWIMVGSGTRVKSTAWVCVEFSLYPAATICPRLFIENGPLIVQSMLDLSNRLLRSCIPLIWSQRKPKYTTPCYSLFLIVEHSKRC